jgi:citrate lyase beta subunit
MSEFRVTPEDVAAASGRLTAIRCEVDELYGHLSGCTSAAAGTPTERAFDDLHGHFAAMLPHFGLAGEQLGVAVAGAGRSYSSCDDDVAGACEAGLSGE